MEPIRASHQVLPLGSENRIAPGRPTRIRGMPTHGPLTLEELILSGAGTDWIINDVEIGGVSQLSVKNLPGAVFGKHGVAAARRRSYSTTLFSGLDVIERDGEVVITVTYVGPNPEGVFFYASIYGVHPPQRPTTLPIDSSGSIKTKATIKARLDAPLRIELMEICCGNDGADWKIHDVRVDGASVLTQPSSPIPGNVFATRGIDHFATFVPGMDIEIDVQYVGGLTTGIPFVGQIFGTVVRNDYSQPPPDVQVLLSFADYSTARTYTTIAVATCRWRQSYVRPTELTAP
jgi:hypothetical protein